MYLTRLTEQLFKDLEILLFRFRKGQVGKFGKTPGSAARAKKKLVKRGFSPFTVCFGSASSCPGWCPVPALPSSRKPSGCQRSPRGELQQRSKSLLPGCFLFTQQKQRSRAHLETRIKSRASLPCRHPICILPAQKKPCRGLIQT